MVHLLGQVQYENGERQNHHARFWQQMDRFRYLSCDDTDVNGKSPRSAFRDEEVPTRLKSSF